MSRRANKIASVAITELRVHPYATVVPELSSGALQALADDIAARGLQVPLDATPENFVLDGRARLTAARMLGQETVPVRVVQPASEEEHILLAAIRRRQLSVSQAAALALDLESNQQARREARERSRANLGSTEVAALPPRGRTRERIANDLGIGARMVQYAASVQERDADLFSRIRRGEISAERAFLDLQRRERYAEIGEASAMPDGPFEVILADPPWKFGALGSAHAPEQHYPTMPTADIAALDIPSEDDAVLFLWVVSSLLQDALDVARAWGFEQHSTLVWIKPSIGPGVWARNRHELVYICRKGKYPPPEPSLRLDLVIEAPRGRHSEKPASIYEFIEHVYPHAKGRLELFARNARPGWTAWGNQAPS